MLEATDEALCGMIRQGDAAAFNVLYDRYRHQLYGYVLRLCGSQDVALDAVQEVFLQVWLRSASLDPGRSIKSYLFRSVRNYLLDYLKKAVHQQAFRQHFMRAFEEGGASSEHVLYSKQLETIKNNAVSRLPAQRQRIYTMSKVEGLSNREIAESLGISINTVRDQLVKASRFVRMYLLRHADIAVLLTAVHVAQQG
ncbi:RNA polymerase sigma factor [Chitinophaga sp.]|uniref:RNA polymerase sigma factor n=1 Tax=Chitinophaga sp. TaxID=1869181 RepID=UPI00261C5BA0|nr:RNA polymerase sigma-70 factor [uncultured Chitinophaga sp.]